MQLLIPCAVGNPDRHWILYRVDLEKQTICIYDPLYKKMTFSIRRKQIAPLLYFIPAILQYCGYFQQKCIPLNVDALSYKCPDDWMLYALGDKPRWGKCWLSVRHVSTLNVTHFQKSKYTKRY